ncbi:MAG: hypothetical protein FJY95_23075 [Candidatus Handelsmanbacteria bacterium]|nr:hypothetical protein [Candidatus Handelsmanbacteria bacterium]
MDPVSAQIDTYLRFLSDEDEALKARSDLLDRCYYAVHGELIREAQERQYQRQEGTI